jgi:nicotinate-nucleotide pyrophosphorylase (carboxylating)
MELTRDDIRRIVDVALVEDVGDGDRTTLTLVPADARCSAQLLLEEPGVVCGVPVAAAIFEALDPDVRVEQLLAEGAAVSDTPAVVALIEGPARAVLTGERTALNLVARLSGIASLTHRYVELVDGTHAKVLDTRKTTPGLRRLEKAAAAAGGVTNHRMGLFDAILIKNNHIVAAGGVRQAIGNARASGLPVEIEVRDIDELKEALASGATHLLLDNLSPQQAEEWVRIVDGRATVELSGGIDLDNVRSYAETGADFVSAGAITHSAPAVDISFRLELL